MSHTGAWWILGFQPYKPNRSLTTSMLRCSKRQISFSFVFDWKRATGNMKNSTFWKRSFWRRFLCRVLWRLHRSPWKLAEKVIVGARKETPLWVPRFSFAFKKIPAWQAPNMPVLAVKEEGRVQHLKRAWKSAYMCFQGLVEEPVPTAVWLQRLGCFFFSRKKKVLCAHGARAGCNSLARTRQSAPARWVLRFSDCRLVWRRVLVSQKCRRSQNFSFLLFKEKFQWAFGVQ